MGKVSRGRLSCSAVLMKYTRRLKGGEDSKASRNRRKKSSMTSHRLAQTRVHPNMAPATHMLTSSSPPNAAIVPTSIGQLRIPSAKPARFRNMIFILLRNCVRTRTQRRKQDTSVRLNMRRLRYLMMSYRRSKSWKNRKNRKMMKKLTKNQNQKNKNINTQFKTTKEMTQFRNHPKICLVAHLK